LAVPQRLERSPLNRYGWPTIARRLHALYSSLLERGGQ
jgi:hypothetical protein